MMFFCTNILIDPGLIVLGSNTGKPDVGTQFLDRWSLLMIAKYTSEIFSRQRSLSVLYRFRPSRSSRN